MNKQFIVLGSIIVVLFAAVATLPYFYSAEDCLDDYQDLLNTHLQERESEVESILDDSLLLYQLSIPSILGSQEATHLLSAENLVITERPFSIFSYWNDSLAYWSTNHYQLSDRQLQQLKTGELDNKLVQVANILAKVRHRKFENGMLAVGIIPISNQFNGNIKSSFLSEGFIIDNHIPAEVLITNEKTEHPIVSKLGVTIGYLTTNGPFRDRSVQIWRFSILVLAFVLLCWLIILVAIHLKNRYAYWYGGVLVLLSLFPLNLLITSIDIGTTFQEIEIVNKLFSVVVLDSSLGELLVNIILLLWAMVFFNREFDFPIQPSKIKWLNYFLGFIQTLAVVMSLSVVIVVYQEITMSESIDFNFDNILKIDRFGFLAIVGLVLLLAAFYLFSHRMIQTIHQLGLNVWERIAILFLVSLAILPFIEAGSIQLPTLYIILIAFIFIWLFDLTATMPKSVLTFGIIWFIGFSAFSAGMLTFYRNTKDIKQRWQYSIDLANIRDQSAEKEINELRDAILEDDLFQQLLDPQPGVVISNQEIDARLNRIKSEKNYLYANYEIGLFAFKTQATDTVDNSKIQELEHSYQIGKQTPFSFLRAITHSDEASSYLSILNPTNQTDIKLYLEARKKGRELSRLRSEFLTPEPFKGLGNLHKYEYAVYKRGNRIASNSNYYPQKFQAIYALPPSQEIQEVVRTANESQTIYSDDAGNIVMMRRKYGGYGGLFSIFSFNLLVCIFITIFFIILNSFLGSLPSWTKIRFRWNQPLSTKIQASSITIILLTFLVIGYFSYNFFQDSSAEYHKDRLARKVSSVMKNAEYELAHNQGREDVKILDLPEMLSTIHLMDINIYDTNGRLITSSENLAFDQGIITPLINPVAFYEMKHQNVEEVIINDNLGDLSYKTAFKAIYDVNNNVLGYFSTPYYADQKELRSDISEFLGTMLNIWAMLLIFSIIVAVMVSNSITAPLRFLADQIRNTELGNDIPISYDRNDEVGMVIGRLNQMISKMNDDSKSLAQAEKEGAWRQMAKQIAHEIKNPLTPMKLSVQYLQHTMTSSSANREEVINRVAATFIEQIESLNRIASEFSTFAKMPTPENTLFCLNELVLNVYQLYVNERYDMVIRAHLPPEQYYVYADKSHLLQVFNNLLQNAIQAIPKDRHGRIDINLYTVKENIVTIKVSDNGTGIPEEMQEKVFMPNFTTKSSGSGLGLAISRQIMSAVEGQIYFETKKDVGTHFFVELKLHEIVSSQEEPLEIEE